MNEKQKHIIIVVVIGLVVILISTGVGFYAYHNAKHAKSVPEDQGSKDRLTMLNEVFTSLFGPQWPFILVGFALLILLIMVLLFLLTKKEYSLSDEASSALTKALIAFTVVFAIGMVSFAVKAYVDQRVKEDTGDIPNYTPSADERKKLYELFAIIGLGLVLLLIVGGITWHFWRKKHPAPKKPVSRPAPSVPHASKPNVSVRAPPASTSARRPSVSTSARRQFFFLRYIKEMLTTGAKTGTIVAAAVLCVGCGVGLYFLLRPKSKSGKGSASPPPDAGGGDAPDDVRGRLSELQKKIGELSNYAKNTQGDLLVLSNQALRNGDQISLLANSEKSSIYQLANATKDGNWQGEDENSGFNKMWIDSLKKSYSTNAPGFPNSSLGGYLHRGTGSGAAWVDGNVDSKSNTFNNDQPTWSEFYMLKSWQGDPESETPKDPFAS